MIFLERSPNALAVFTDATGLGDAAMQALSRELNLSESVFVFRDFGVTS